MAPREMKEGDWICLSCDNHNFANKQVCNRCGGPKPPPPGQGRDGDWMCPACDNHNWARREECNKCGEPKPQAEKGGRKGGNGEKGGRAGGGGKGGGRPPPVRSYSPPPAPAPPAQARGGDFKEGDWNCEECGNHNWARRDACNKCGAPKPDDGGYRATRRAPPASRPSPYDRAPPPSYREYDRAPPPSYREYDRAPPSGAYDRRPSSGPSTRAPPRTSFAPPPKPPPVPSRATFSPRAPPAGKGGGPPMREGDWECIKCGNVNFARRENCNRCQWPKNAPANFRDGDWMCPECGNHNFASKDSCNRCQAPKP